MLFALEQMLGPLFCCSLKILPTILLFQPFTLSWAFPWHPNKPLKGQLSRRGCIAYVKECTSLTEAQTGSVEKENGKVKLLILVTEMLDIEANKCSAMYKIPETHRPQLFTHDC